MENPMLATLGGGALLNQFGLPNLITDRVPFLGDQAGQNWLGELLGKVPGIGGTVDLVLGGQEGPQYQTLGSGIKNLFTGGAGLPPQLGGSSTVQDAINYLGGQIGLTPQDQERQKQLNQRRELQKINWEVPLAVGAGAHEYQKKYLEDQPPFPGDETSIDFQTAQQAMDDPNLRFKPQEQYANVAEGGRIGYQDGGNDPQAQLIAAYKKYKAGGGKLSLSKFIPLWAKGGLAQGGRIGYADGTAAEWIQRNRLREIEQNLPLSRRAPITKSPHTSEEGIESILQRYAIAVQKLKDRYGSDWRAKREELSDEGINMADVLYGNEYAQGV